VTGDRPFVPMGEKCPGCGMLHAASSYACEPQTAIPFTPEQVRTYWRPVVAFSDQYLPSGEPRFGVHPGAATGPTLTPPAGPEGAPPRDVAPVPVGALVRVARWVWRLVSGRRR
jgi:hypothetical protein